MSHCGSWGGKTQGKKNMTPTGGSQITDTYQLSDIWLIGPCGCNTVDTGTFSIPDGYRCQIISLVLSLCSSRSCILLSQILFVLFLRFIDSRETFCTNIDGALLDQRGPHHIIIYTLHQQPSPLNFKLCSWNSAYRNMWMVRRVRAVWLIWKIGKTSGAKSSSCLPPEMSVHWNSKGQYAVSSNFVGENISSGREVKGNWQESFRLTGRPQVHE